MRMIKVRDVSLCVDIVGRGDPVLLMHGGPGVDHWSLWPFRQLADRFTLIFYDHRCNGRSTGAPVASMTWDNLTADAEALRERLGFERWAVLGHSFGGHVALEYSLRYPHSVSHLVLLDTAGESRWSQQHAAEELADRGYSPRKVDLARRWFNGEVPHWQFMLTPMRLGNAYNPHSTLLDYAREISAERHSKMRPEALTFAGRHLIPGWTVMDRLGEITAPTLVMAGREDFVFPPESQRELVARLPDARLYLVERAGHNPHSERTDEVMRTVSDFMTADVGERAPLS